MSEQNTIGGQVRPDGLSLGRDLPETRAALRGWLARKMPAASGLELSELTVPGGSGSASETLLFEASWDEGGEAHMVPLVARIKPTTLGHHYQDHFEDEFRILEILGARSSVPVPKTFWYEYASDLLGAPFCVLEQVDGVVPADNPPFNTTGFLVDASPVERNRLWRSALDALCRLHTADLGDLAFLEPAGAAQTGLEYELDQAHRANEWAVGDDQLDPVVQDARNYLIENYPARTRQSLAWGDARIGNMMFRDFACVAVLDWDMASLGGPLVDLGFWTFMQGSWPGPVLDGLGDREQTLAIWQHETGIDVNDVLWYEVFAGYRLCAALISHDHKVRLRGGKRTDYRTVKERESEGGPTTITYEDMSNPRRMIEALATLL